MKTKYSIYVNDARKGSTYRDGFKQGWLGENRIDDSHSLALQFDSIEGAREAIAKLGATDSTSVETGKLTAYVAHYLGRN